MTSLRSAHAICEIDGTARWTAATERVVRLFASGRITRKQYLHLLRAAVTEEGTGLDHPGS